MNHLPRNKLKISNKTEVKIHVKFPSLPPEIIVKIFEFLPCHQLYLLVHDPIFRSYSFNHYYKRILISDIRNHKAWSLWSQREPEFTDEGRYLKCNNDIQSPFEDNESIVFRTVASFIDFTERHKNIYYPHTIIIEDSEDLFTLFERKLSLLSQAKIVYLQKKSINYQKLYKISQFCNIKGLSISGENDYHKFISNNIDLFTGLKSISLNNLSIHSWNNIIYKIANYSGLSLIHTTIFNETNIVLPERLKRLTIKCLRNNGDSNIMIDLNNVEQLEIEDFMSFKINLSEAKQLKILKIKKNSNFKELPKSIQYFELFSSLPDDINFKDYHNLTTLVLDSINYNEEILYMELPPNLMSLTYKNIKRLHIHEEFIDNKNSLVPIDDRVRLPPNLITLQFIKCASFQIKAQYFQVPSKVKNLIINEAGNILGDISQLSLPKCLIKLSIASSKLESIDNCQFPGSLIELILAGNKLAYIKNTNLASLVNLRILNLSGNRINEYTSLKNELPVNLIQLDLGDNKLTCCYGLPCNSVVDVNLSNNKLDGKISNRILNLPKKVQILNLEGNSIKTFGIHYKFPSRLTAINLKYNNICTLLGENFFNMLPHSLRSLELSSNKLRFKITDKKIILPQSLESIKLSNNKLTINSINFVSFKQCPRLKRLDLQGNSIDEYDLSNLPASIEIMNLSNCKLCSLHGPFSRFPNLIVLSLNHNNVRDYMARNKFHFPPNIKMIDLQKNDLVSFHQLDIYDCCQLQYINLLGNNNLELNSIISICQELRNLKSFKSLFINKEIIAKNNELKLYQSYNILKIL